jgi:hypothetical protein
MKIKEAVASAIRSDKKQSDFKWREWLEHAERTQELYARASQSQRIAKIELGNGKSPVLLLPFSDQHIGGRGVLYKEFRRLTDEILSTPNLYVALVGDLLEWAVKLRSVAEVCAQIFGPDKQLQFAEDWFKEIKHKVAFSTWDNHEGERSEKQLGLSLLKHAFAPSCVFFDGIGHADVTVGKQTYHIAASHKFRGHSYLNTCHAGQRYMRFQGVDREIAIMGDIHQPAFMHYYDGPKERLSLVAGTLNVNSVYAARYFSIFTQPHYPCIELDPKEHRFTPFKSLSEWRRFRCFGRN